MVLLMGLIHENAGFDLSRERERGQSWAAIRTTRDGQPIGYDFDRDEANSG